MSNQNLEVLVNTLSAQVVQQGQQIAELQKQLADMQKATSCDLDDTRETRNEIISSALEQSDYATSRLNQLFIKEAVIKSDNFHINSDGNSCFSLTHGANVKNNKE